MGRYHVSILEDALEPAAWMAEITPNPDTGAIATFLGLCRAEGGRLEALELEHYPGMAEAEIGRILETAHRRWPLFGILAVHRTGLVKVGEPIVFVAAGSTHRDAAFDAVRFVMDYLKTDAPFWKREHLKGGVVGEWVEAQSKDDTARARWSDRAQDAPQSTS
ncbi:MAG: molybdenum cofactor biosynthesis protein MoaE [Pseudomonadota bacterium]